MATIALVDDDENIVEALTAFFEAEGYQVRAYHDGASALAGLSETPSSSPQRRSHTASAASTCGNRPRSRRRNRNLAVERRNVATAAPP